MLAVFRRPQAMLEIEMREQKKTKQEKNTRTLQLNYANLGYVALSSIHFVRMSRIHTVREVMKGGNVAHSSTTPHTHAHTHTFHSNKNLI